MRATSRADVEGEGARLRYVPVCPNCQQPGREHATSRSLDDISSASRVIDKIMLSLAAFADEIEREKARQRTYDAMLRFPPY